MDAELLKAKAKRLGEVNKIIEKLDPAIRQQAFELLKPYISAGKEADGKKSEGESGLLSLETGEEFFSKFAHEKPADNAVLLAAYHYSQFGSQPFSMEEMKQLAGDIGITIPERLDMTYFQLKRDGKNFFKRAAKGQFKPTVHGEAYLKKTYKVTKGKMKKAPQQRDE